MSQSGQDSLASSEGQLEFKPGVKGPDSTTGRSLNTDTCVKSISSLYLSMSTSSFLSCEMNPMFLNISFILSAITPNQVLRPRFMSSQYFLQDRPAFTFPTIPLCLPCLIKSPSVTSSCFILMWFILSQWLRV